VTAGAAGFATIGRFINLFGLRNRAVAGEVISEHRP